MPKYDMPYKAEIVDEAGEERIIAGSEIITAQNEDEAYILLQSLLPLMVEAELATSVPLQSTLHHGTNTSH